MLQALIGGLQTRSTYQVSVMRTAFILRLGLGGWLVVEALIKFLGLLSPTQFADMLGFYLGTAGYINQFFQYFLFQSSWGHLLTPASLLALMAMVELVVGCSLIAGLAVKWNAMLTFFMLVFYVIALPVMTIPNVQLEVAVYTAPAPLVQIREVAMAIAAFVLYKLGPGFYSVSNELNGIISEKYWYGLWGKLRYALILPLVVAALFGGFGHIPTFAAPAFLLAALGAALTVDSLKVVRWAAWLAALVFFHYALFMIDWSDNWLKNIYAVRREFGLVSISVALALIKHP
ncbi:DoxX family membrane protein [Endozoicomonas sp. SM1973]|uniref:DoxX family membrane protein n=1 Tax=Spartinivicinus marinus TaxID=2994442 RepID=A0A853I154_9GAMM|nr:DoxX family membrane protein [Spartinivicinus marinus]MCX4028601.1 DoxX family membrane protein [Spartinivicinus marinus]NYZ67133.1 DoxX family membrane protein [Spartinivicinus marinus]